MEKLIIKKNQIRYRGTDYTVLNVPYGMTKEEVLKACGEEYGWWVSDFRRYGNTVQFNINFD